MWSWVPSRFEVVARQTWDPAVRHGLTGSVRFDKRGDIAAPPITILRIRRGQHGLPNFPGAALERVVSAPAG